MVDQIFKNEKNTKYCYKLIGKYDSIRVFQQHQRTNRKISSIKIVCSSVPDNSVHSTQRDNQNTKICLSIDG